MSLLLLLLLLQAGRCGPDPAVLHTLRSCELLECLTNGQLIMLAGMLQPRVYEDGDVITHQGDTADGSCFIVAQVRFHANKKALNER
jgi:hypothetical protein